MVKLSMLRDLTLAAMVAAMLCTVLAVDVGNQAAAQSAQAVSSPHEATRQACANDLHTLCAGILPGGGRIQKCVIEKHDLLSDACKSGMLAARNMSGK